jgi:RimJ/RimL family protein N-acetyltransferase
MADMRIREAQVGDAAAIAAVHVRSWQAAYRGLLPQDLLDGLDPERRRAGWEQVLGAADRRGAATLLAETLLAERTGEVVAFADVRASRDADADPASVGELTSIYAVPEVWGGGVGRELLAVSVAHLAAAGYREATLWVLDTNDRARRFYAAAGWRPDGAVKRDEEAGVVLDEVRYRRLLP